MTCLRKHKYAILGQTFDSLREAEDYIEKSPAPRPRYWVAYHPGMIEEIVKNPEIASYCPEESHIQESNEAEDLAEAV